MKKKLTAALLTLCMVISLLPLSALAASWTAKLGSDAVTVTEDENGRLSVVRDSDQQDLTQYYTFEKVTQGTVDTFKYYSLDGVHTGTLTEVVAIEETTGETTVEGDTATTEVTLESGKTPSVAPEVTPEQVTTLVSSETVNLEVSLKDAAGKPVDHTPKLTYTVPENLIAEAVKNSTAAKEVAISLPVSGFKVTLPVTVIKDDLKSQVKLTITASDNGIDIKLEDGGKLEDAKAPVSVEFNAPSNASAATHTVAFKNGSVFERMRGGFSNGKAWFMTRHFSEFVVVESGSVVAATMENKGSGNRHTFALEQDETLVAALKSSTGSFNYVWSSPKAAEMGEDTYDANVTAPDAEIGNLWAVIGDPAVNTDGTPNIKPETIIGIPAGIEIDE